MSKGRKRLVVFVTAIIILLAAIFIFMFSLFAHKDKEKALAPELTGMIENELDDSVSSRSRKEITADVITKKQLLTEREILDCIECQKKEFQENQNLLIAQANAGDDVANGEGDDLEVAEGNGIDVNDSSNESSGANIGKNSSGTNTTGNTKSGGKNSSSSNTSNGSNASNSVSSGDSQPSGDSGTVNSSPNGGREYVAPQWLSYASCSNATFTSEQKAYIDSKISQWTSGQISKSTLYTDVENKIENEWNISISSFGATEADISLYESYSKVPDYNASISSGTSAAYFFIGLYTKGEYDENGYLIGYYWEAGIFT